MKIFPLTIYVLLKPFIQILPSDSKKSLWDSRTTATLASSVERRVGRAARKETQSVVARKEDLDEFQQGGGGRRGGEHLAAALRLLEFRLGNVTKS
jgi:hypothetical protein